VTRPDETPLEARVEIARKTVRNFRDHIYTGFLKYRKSVTDATNFASTEWTGQMGALPFCSRPCYQTECHRTQQSRKFKVIELR